MDTSLICTMNVSLDGYVTDPGGGLEWTGEDAELFRFVTEQTRALKAYVMGRRLYETMRYWETVQDAVLDDDAGAWAQMWRPLPKVVFSTTLTAVEGNARLATGGLAEELARLEGDGDVAIGGPTLAAEAARLGLLDEYQPRVVPVLLGGGLRFYPHDDDDGAGPARLALAESRTFASQTVWSRYRVAR
jgi:dihydrofolate reductase